MTTNVEFLEANDKSSLGDVRQRLGAEDENDTSFDDKINEMSSQEIVEKWSGWNLGDEAWASQMIEMFTSLNEER